MSIQGISIILTFSIMGLFSWSFFEANGHGLGYEILPPVQLGDKQVSLEVTSSQYTDPKSSDKKITLAFFDTTTGITIREVTYHIIATKGNQFLFEETFQRPDGILVMSFIPAETETIQIQEEKEGGFLEALTGSQQEVVVVKGPPFSSGGLYKFKVEIQTAESFSTQLVEPIQFDVGLSLPDQTNYDIMDPNFGQQQIGLITYYDRIENFRYEPNTRTITFSMPFQWSFDNINQTSVVHEELLIPKTFGDLMVSEYSLLVNRIQVPERVITIDEFSEKARIVHLVLNQNDLFNLLEKQKNSDTMNFLLKPKDEDLPLSTITGNGQFRISLAWKPEEIKSGSTTTFFFNITDVFLKNKPVSVDYDLNIIHNDKVIYSSSGISTASREEHNVIDVSIPPDVSGIMTLQFDNLDGNSLARVGIPVVIDRISSVSIPDWVRNNAGWWAEGQISDNDFASGIEFMIKEGIIKVPTTSSAQVTDAVIPDWVRNNAGWWAEGEISDQDFANGIQHLIKNGIISV